MKQPINPHIVYATVYHAQGIQRDKFVSYVAKMLVQMNDPFLQEKALMILLGKEHERFCVTISTIPNNLTNNIQVIPFVKLIKETFNLDLHESKLKFNEIRDGGTIQFTFDTEEKAKIFLKECIDLGATASLY